MSDHSQYEELAALAAGGHLGDDELSDFQRHLETCAQCRNAVAQFGELVHFGVPLVQGRYRPDTSMITSRANPGATERFIKRAAAEGIEFSRDVRKRDFSSGSLLSLSLGPVAPAALLVTIVYDSHLRSHTPHQQDHQNGMQAQQQLEQLTRQNSVFDAAVSRLERTLGEQQHETEGLRAQLETQNVAATSARHDDEQAQSASRNAQSLEETQAQRKVLERQLADRGAELARLNLARASDQAELVAKQVHINELSRQSKTATANIDMKRQLATAGKDVRELTTARQLHVVDVSDTDPKGKAGNAFGRVFLTEGKSLILYAFDLNDAKRLKRLVAIAQT
jgi:hypothetical protein